MSMDHYEFLGKLYETVQPRIYLEIGVQSGRSLSLAVPHCGRIAGVDIDMSNVVPAAKGPNVGLYECTSYEFFNDHQPDFTNVDGESELGLVLIDGSHLIEDVWGDFLGAEALAGGRTIICFDDVLPRNNYEATRDFHEGAWAGDVWKIWYLLQEQRPYYPAWLVDTQPCGKLIVLPNGNLPKDLPAMDWDKITDYAVVPNEILNRQATIPAEAALSFIDELITRGSDDPA
jgi:hypothetical protein